MERKGGLAGFGGPGSRVRSVGSIDLRTLSRGDREVIDELFAGAAASDPTSGGPVHADAFQYHLTLVTATGERTVVVPEHKVPAPIRDAVHDEM